MTFAHSCQVCEQGEKGEGVDGVVEGELPWVLLKGRNREMHSPTNHELQDNELLHQDYLAGFEDGIMYRRGLGHWEDFKEIWNNRSEHYVRGLVEAVGFDPRG